MFYLMILGDVYMMANEISHNKISCIVSFVDSLSHFQIFLVSDFY